MVCSVDVSNTALCRLCRRPVKARRRFCARQYFPVHENGSFLRRRGINPDYPSLPDLNVTCYRDAHGIHYFDPLWHKRPDSACALSKKLTWPLPAGRGTAARFIVWTPPVMRTPMGGRRGYGPTHSQCFEKTSSESRYVVPGYSPSV